MSTPDATSGVEDQIEQILRDLGLCNHQELADFLAINRSAISKWKKRGNIPDKILRKLHAAMAPAASARGVNQRRKEFSQLALYEGLCLAIWLAPSLDAFGRRFGAANFTGTLRQYASLFTEIEVACAEEIEAKLREIGGANATLAFEELTKEPAEPLMERILQRAHHWRFGDASS